MSNLTMERQNFKKQCEELSKKQNSKKSIEMLRFQLRQKCRESMKEHRQNAFQERRVYIDSERKHDFLNIVRQEVETLESDINLQNKIYEELRAEVDYWIEEEIHYLTNLEEDVTICPLCKISPLIVKFNAIFCSCGLNISYKSGPPGLTSLNEFLQKTLSDHGLHCSHDVRFYVDQSVENEKMNSLHSVCFHCDFFRIFSG